MTSPDITAKIEGGILTISLPLKAAGMPSKSGKSNIQASTNGFAKTDVMVGGKPLLIAVNAVTMAK